MKTLSDFKRMAKVGSLVKHKIIVNGVVILENTRPISVVQSNAVAFRNEDGQDSWLYFPKASDVRFANGEMSIVRSAELSRADGSTFTRTQEMIYQFV